MNAFQRKSLYAALASVGALGAATTAQAVNVNPNGLGQVLIYPYYTVNATVGISLDAPRAYNSLLSVVNSTDSAKVVKVRFLEGKHSQEVLDFNLFLSKHDVWVAAVIPSPVTTGGRLLVTAADGSGDRSCTEPPIAVSQGGSGFVDFVNYQYTGSNDDKGGSGLDRTREGYAEIIEMGTFTSTDTISVTVTHKSGTPECNQDWLTDDDFIASHIRPNSGGLFGGMTLINVAQGTDFTEDAVALDNFADGGNGFYTSPGSITPDLSLADPPTSIVIAGGDVFLSSWAAGPDPVSAVLMHDQVMNEYVLDAGLKAGTDWVITFPTKRYTTYVKVGTGSAPKLFQKNFNDGAGSCDDVSLNIYDREERTTSTPVSFSPPPPTPGNSICWEANVVTFNNSNVLASSNTANINTTFEHGWLNLGFFPQSPPAGVTGTVHQLTSTNTTVTDPFGFFLTGQTATYFGLPLVGFMVESFLNGVQTIGGVVVQNNYGGNFVHKTMTFVEFNLP